VREEVAGAAPLAVFKADRVAVIIAADFSRKLFDADAFRLLGVALCLFYLADKTRLHGFTSFKLKSTVFNQPGAFPPVFSKTACLYYIAFIA
jgi:hypothetical protein